MMMPTSVLVIYIKQKWFDFARKWGKIWAMGVAQQITRSKIIDGRQKNSALLYAHHACIYPSACTNVARFERGDLLSVASFTDHRLMCNAASEDQ